jgi:hypothetical protein
MLLLDDGHRPRLLLFHAHINLLGFVTLTVLGTLLTLWPTVLRTRIADTAPRAATRALPPSLIGDDGTFSVPNKIILAKGVPTVVSVTALPSSQGMHGAVLTIIGEIRRGREGSGVWSTPWPGRRGRSGRR